MDIKKVDKMVTKSGKRACKSIYSIGEANRAEIIKEASAEFRKNNTTFGRELAKLMNADDKRLKLAAMQLYVRDVLPKISERDVSANPVLVPQVFIPEKYPDDDTAPNYEPERH